MSNIKITCDSTCDLPQELYTKCNAEVVSLSVALGDELHRDGVDISAPDLFAYVKESGVLPKTSAVSMGEYLDVFGKYVNEGKTVIHISLSSALSSLLLRIPVALVFGSVLNWGLVGVGMAGPAASLCGVSLGIWFVLSGRWRKDKTGIRRDQNASEPA